MDTPYFSIIIPMYNAERYIKICINSISVQTFQDFEVIIVDDCSTDNSYKICQELYGNNEKIRLLQHEKNLGQGPARNFGLKNARGEYIFFVDSDDAIIPNALEKLHKATQAERGGVDAVHLKGIYLTSQDDDQPIKADNLTLHWEENPNVGFLTENIPRRLMENWAYNPIDPGTPNTVYRRKFLLENEIEYPDCWGEDRVFQLAAMCFAKKYFIAKDLAVYVYRMHPSSLTHNPDIGKYFDSMLAIIESLKKILDKVPELDGNRILKEQCMIPSFEIFLKFLANPFYEAGSVSVTLDAEVYKAMLPIFGENTTIAKYFFHKLNVIQNQAEKFVQLLNKSEAQLQKQTRLIEQLRGLLNQYDIDR